MKKISTDTYDILIGDVLSNISEFLAERNYKGTCIIVDENTKRDCLGLLQAEIGENIPVIEIQSGEINKTIRTCEYIWSEMARLNLGRNSLTINLGGGVIGDMGGFCASTYKRGMDFIQIPTTLLSQVDASVGGKLGVDFKGLKNAVGVFNNPQAVFIHPQFLRTLPEREVRSGMAEIIKHGLIQDKTVWDEVKQIQDLNATNWANFIHPSIQVKHRVVTEDPYEKGLRKCLNFGHTIGHAIESVFLETDQPLLHGEAIAIGMICEGYISMKQVGLSKESLKDFEAFILKHYGKISIPMEKMDAMIAIMKNDKKNESDEINFSLISSIGVSRINQTANLGMIQESLAYYASL